MTLNQLVDLVWPEELRTHQRNIGEFVAVILVRSREPLLPTEDDDREQDYRNAGPNADIEDHLDGVMH